MAEYVLPDVGEGLTEAEIVEWKVAVGDVIAVNDVVVEIETAKSLVELPSPFAGTVEALLVEVGQTVEVGTPIIRIREDSQASTGAPPEAGAAPATAASPADPPPGTLDLSNPSAGSGTQTLVGYGPRAETGSRRRRAAAAGGGATPPAPAPEAASTPGTGTTPAAVRALAKPPVRKLAKDLGIDLTQVSGTGPHGSITRADVQAAAAAPATSPATGTAPARTFPATVGPREVAEPIKGVRKAMAEAMVASAFTAPHVSEWVDVDVTPALELLARLQSQPRYREVRLGFLPLVAKTVLLALPQHPLLNSTWDEAGQQVVLKRYVNLGVAVATERGLVVPNIKDAHALDLVGLAVQLDELVQTARTGRTSPADMAQGTFSITNFGVFGIDAGTPIIPPGESAILGLGAFKRRPWVVERDGVETIEPRDVVTVSLSFDHRHIDGAAASRFLADVAAMLADPALALQY